MAGSWPTRNVTFQRQKAQIRKGTAIMTFVSLWTSMQGLTIEDFRKVSDKHNPPQDIDGLLAWAAGTDEKGLNVVTIWQSKAHQERWTAEQLFPAVQQLRLARR